MDIAWTLHTVIIHSVVLIVDVFLQNKCTFKKSSEEIFGFIQASCHFS